MNSRRYSSVAVSLLALGWAAGCRAPAKPDEPDKAARTDRGNSDPKDGPGSAAAGDDAPAWEPEGEPAPEVPAGLRDRSDVPVPRPPEPKPATTETVRPADRWDADGFGGARVGDFARYELPGALESSLRREVVEVGDRTVTELRVETFGGNVIRTRIRARYVGLAAEADHARPGGATVRGAAASVNVAGRNLPCTVEERFDGDRRVERKWFCREVPFGGLVQSEGPDGKVRERLTDFGRGGN